jgi:hypothetical protein
MGFASQSVKSPTNSTHCAPGACKVKLWVAGGFPPDVGFCRNALMAWNGSNKNSQSKPNLTHRPGCRQPKIEPKNGTGHSWNPEEKEKRGQTEVGLLHSADGD